METSTLTVKGQIVVPARLRKKFGLKKGTKVAFQEELHGFVVKPVDRKYFEHLAGILPSKGKATKSLLNERRKDRKREDIRSR